MFFSCGFDLIKGYFGSNFPLDMLMTIAPGMILTLLSAFVWCLPVGWLLNTAMLLMQRLL